MTNKLQANNSEEPTSTLEPSTPGHALMYVAFSGFIRQPAIRGNSLFTSVHSAPSLIISPKNILLFFGSNRPLGNAVIGKRKDNLPEIRV